MQTGTLNEVVAWAHERIAHLEKVVANFMHEIEQLKIQHPRNTDAKVDYFNKQLERGQKWLEREWEELRKIERVRASMIEQFMIAHKIYLYNKTNQRRFNKRVAAFMKMVADKKL